MKNNSLKIRLLTTLMVLSITFKPIHAQFVSASQTDLTGGIYVTPYNTGNDVYNDAAFSYSVSVCGDVNNSSPSLVWDVFDGSTHEIGSIVLAATNDIYHTDVCLVQFNGDVFAEVVFYAGGTAQAVYLQEYIWGNPGGIWGFYLNNSTFWSAAGVNTVNIDGDHQGNFALTYNDSSDDLFTVTGNCISFNINNSGNTVTLPNKGKVPDVSIFNDGSALEVHYVYVGTSNTTLEVESYSFTALAGGSSAIFTSPLSANAAEGYYYDMPRIASPNSTGSATDFTVVVQETNHSNSDQIVGFNNTTGPSPIVYNDGAYSPYYDLTSVPNKRPVVTYDNQGNTWVGWTYDDYSSGLFYANAITPLIIKCDYNGVPYGSSNYWVVPVGIGDGAAVDQLSLAGRYGRDQLLLTYYNVGNYFDLNYKEIQPTTATSCRTAQDVLSNSNNNTDAPGFYLLKIYNLTGQLVHQELTTELNLHTWQQQINLQPALYVYKINNSAGQTIATGKLSKI